MRIAAILLLLTLLLLQACDYSESETPTAKATLPPVIILDGPKVDTAYLFSSYHDKGADVNEFINDEYRCTDLRVEVTGTVNTRLPGTCFLYYNVTDRRGYPAATLTRTVHVVENAAGFLSGHYDVACTCTISGIGAAAAQHTITAGTYSASVATGRVNGEFDLVPLNIGPEYVAPSSILIGQTMEMGYFGPEYGRSAFSGTLSPAKNSFTISSVVYPYHPTVCYSCKSVFTKRLLIAKNQL